jgi:RNA polymerase sigma-70 factor (ECF subfamily)
MFLLRWWTTRVDRSFGAGKGRFASVADIARAWNYASVRRRPCVSHGATVYVGVTTTMAIAEPADLAYEHAFEAHWTDVFRFALAWTNEWSAAEDLAQDAFLRLWSHRGRIDWSRPVLPWLLVATRRLATDRFRVLRRRLLAPTHAAAIDTDPALRARWLDVGAAMSNLSSLERSALVMTAIQGATYEEAGLVLGTSAGALRAAVSRARAKLENA